MTTIGWPAVARWQAVVALRAVAFAVPYWVAWVLLRTAAG